MPNEYSKHQHFILYFPIRVLKINQNDGQLII